MGRYGIKNNLIDGISVIELTDSEVDGIAEIVPEIGNNVIRFDAAGRQALVPPADLSAFKAVMGAAFRYGTPILSPPNRVRGGRFSYRGKEYQLPLNEFPNHLHGELCTRGWEVVGYGASEAQGAYVTSCFRYAEHPDIVAYFPHSLIFTVTVRLRNGKLEVSGSIHNDGDDEAPFAFGLHPYFSLPLASGESVELTVPAAEEWPVTQEAFVTGMPEATAYSRALTTGVPLETYPALGCSLVSLKRDGDRVSRMKLLDRGYAIAYRVGPEFPFMVLFRPDWADAYSLEPYTCVTDAFNLPYEYALSGAAGIGPGERIRFDTEIWIESL